MQALENYSWPGNVRELINIVERAVITSDGPELPFAEKINPGASDPEPGEFPKGLNETGKKRLFEMEREHILTTLQKIGWIIEGHNGAARLLGINPSTLRSRMKKLGITRPATL
jgi:formate hydrogenlyase transcriptional activator